MCICKLKILNLNKFLTEQGFLLVPHSTIQVPLTQVQLGVRGGGQAAPPRHPHHDRPPHRVGRRRQGGRLPGQEDLPLLRHSGHPAGRRNLRQGVPVEDSQPSISSENQTKILF